MQVRNHPISHALALTAFLAVLAACSPQPTTQATLPASSTSASVPSRAATTAPTEISPVGDVPDNAVFVTYTSASGAYSIQYVEGWTVTEGANDGVLITDIDSSEIVMVIPAPGGDLTAYVQATDEPQLQAQAQDYTRVDLETVQVHNQPVLVLSYNSTSVPDAVTGKQRAVTSLRYYLPSPDGKQLALLTLTTPPDVDNVDAFNQMLGSFTWTA